MGGSCGKAAHAAAATISRPATATRASRPTREARMGLTLTGRAGRVRRNAGAMCHTDGIRTTLDIDDDLMATLLARLPGRSKTEAVEHAIDRFLSSDAVDRLKALAGTLDIQDLSDELRRVDRSSDRCCSPTRRSGSRSCAPARRSRPRSSRACSTAARSWSADPCWPSSSPEHAHRIVPHCCRASPPFPGPTWAEASGTPSAWPPPSCAPPARFSPSPTSRSPSPRTPQTPCSGQPIATSSG